MGSAERTGAGQKPHAVDGPLSGYRILDLTTVRRRRPAPSTPSRTCSPIPTSPAGASSGASPTRARARPSRSARRPASPARPRRCAAPRPSSGSTPCRRSRKPGSNRPRSTACSAAGPPSSPDPGPPPAIPPSRRAGRADPQRSAGSRNFFRRSINTSWSLSSHSHSVSAAQPFVIKASSWRAWRSTFRAIFACQ